MVPRPCALTPLPSLRIPLTVGRELAQRGALLEVLPGETEGAFRERIDTAVMALFRDTRRSDVFEVLYERASGPVLEWLRRLLSQQRCALDPLDVLQDTFVNVYRYSARFRDERTDSFRVWVRTIASNAMRRARAQTPRKSESELAEELGEAVAPRAEPARSLHDAEDLRELEWTWLLFLDHYARAYAGLGPRDQAALALVEVERLSYAEAGARLAVGASNMKMIMFRARQRLIARMERTLGVPARAEAEAESERELAPALRAVG